MSIKFTRHRKGLKSGGRASKRDKFRANYHVAKEINGFRCDAMIEKYPPQYSTPKYLLFMREMLRDGWEAKIYEVERSKYVFITKDDFIFKIRFSNHKPIYQRQKANDCDFYVGISHKQTFTTEQVIEKIKNIYENRSNNPDRTKLSSGSNR